MTELRYLIVFVREIPNETPAESATDSAGAANSTVTAGCWQVQAARREAFTGSKAQRSEP
jgi:hypothetical protein